MKTISWPMRTLAVIERAGRFPLDDRGFEYAYRHDTHALHLYDYQGRIRMQRRLYDIEPGDLVFSVAGVNSLYDLREAGHHWCVHFRPAPEPPDVIQLPVHLRAPTQRANFAEAMAEITRLHNTSGDSQAHAAAAVVLQGLLLKIAGVSNAPPLGADRANRAVEALLRLLDEQFAEPWTVPALADAVGMKQDYLSRRFRAHCGVTIPRYLLQRRVAHARYLLEQTDLPIHRIGARVGMPDAQHFNKQFRRLEGVSPSRAREAAMLQ